MTELPGAKFTPADVASAFRSSAMTALAELAQYEAIVDDTDSYPALPVDGPIVTAVVSLRRSFPGRLTLVAPVHLANQLAQRYLPEGATLTNDMIDDVIGEFANVIGGLAKTALKRTPYHFGMSPPLVTRTEPNLATNAEPIPEKPAQVSPDSDACVSLGIDVEPGRMTLTVLLPWCPDAMVAS